MLISVINDKNSNRGNAERILLQVSTTLEKKQFR